jgi:uncharacterized protein (TIGR03437 family)
VTGTLLSAFRLLAICSTAAWIQAGQAQVVDASTLNGKVLLGYQGWFRCPGGGTSGVNWSHWANGTPSAASITIDMYPDLREFEAGELCAVPGMSIGTDPAYLFSAGNSQTVARHFSWMQQYGLDGVLVQRFVTDIPGNRAGGDVVLQNVMAAAERYGRVFAIEYDISGANAATLAASLQQDWNYLVDTLGVTSHPAYLHHNGKPVVSVWGIGLNDGNHPPNDPDAALQLVQGFQAQAQVTYLGGTPAYWRTLSNDAYADPRWTAVYQAMDGIQPWTVGRYASVSDVDRWKTDRLEPDLAATAQHQQLYMPVIFPGFSWHNLNRTAPENQIPRSGGQFLWQQAYNAWTAGAQMLKIAMFDEVNESTAMFKLASRRQDAPDQGYWLTLDADGATLPSDWYLRLAGEITRVFHGQSTAAASLPSNPGPPWPGSDGTLPLSVQNGASFAAGPLAAEEIGAIYATGVSLPADATLTIIDSSGAGRTAQLLYASSQQLDFVAPAGAAPGPATLVVAGADGKPAYGSAAIAHVAPGIFTAAGNGQGPAAATVRVALPDGSETSMPVAVCADDGSCQAVPVDLGLPGSLATLDLYGTGIRGRSSLAGVSCTIGATEAPVSYAGPQGDLLGVDLVSVSLPRSLLGTGLTSIRLVVDGSVANSVQLDIK